MKTSWKVWSELKGEWESEWVTLREACWWKIFTKTWVLYTVSKSSLLANAGLCKVCAIQFSDPINKACFAHPLPLPSRPLSPLTEMFLWQKHAMRLGFTILKYIFSSHECIFYVYTHNNGQHQFKEFYGIVPSAEWWLCEYHLNSIILQPNPMIWCPKVEWYFNLRAPDHGIWPQYEGICKRLPEAPAEGHLVWY